MGLEDALKSAADYHTDRYFEIKGENENIVNFSGKNDLEFFMKEGTDKIAMLYHGILGGIAYTAYTLIKN